MKLIQALFAIALVAACVAVDKNPPAADGGLAKAVGQVLAKASAETAAPTPAPTPEQELAASIDDVFGIAFGSSCARTAHGSQGAPPKHYLRGAALSFVRSVCHPERPGVKIASQPIGDSYRDALAHYGVKSDDAGDRLAITYALMLGSAARESSWRWCVGKDPAAKPTDVKGCASPGSKGETCEAGLYQTSSNSQSQSPVLAGLFKEFKASSAGCFSAEYKGAVTCSDANMKNWGNDPEHVRFQELTKQCPGFATEYHAVMLRVNRRHYGPINSHLADLKPACVDMFGDIGEYVKTHPRICRQF